MKKYRVTFVTRSHIPWKAFTYERDIEATNLNDLIDKALTKSDIDEGTRILYIKFFSEKKLAWLEVDK